MILNQTRVEQAIDKDERGPFVKELVLVRFAATGGLEVPLAMVRKRCANAGGTLATVLLIHGYGQNRYAWHLPARSLSNYLARAGFDVFAMDTTGYGRSIRPAAMNDPCNLARDRQAPFIPSLIPGACAPSYPHAMTTIASDWNDIGAVVDYVRALRRVDKVSLLAWSLGGPRAGGYAAQHPEKVHKLVLLAPAYNRAAPAAAPAKNPPDGTAMNTQSREDFSTNWDRQIGCPGQYEPAVADAVWSEMLASDPVGATWGPGVRRAPQTATWGWNQGMVGKVQAPTLMVVGQHDKQVSPDRVRELYTDIASPQKMFAELACASHNAMWETNRLVLFRASLEWLTRGSVNGTKEGIVRLGY